MIKELLKKLHNRTIRTWVASAIALVIVLVVGVPALDSFFARRAEYARLARELAKFQDSMRRLPDLEELVNQRGSAAAKSPNRAEAGSDLTHSFRSRIVELCRQSRCQVRQIQVGEQRRRDWKKGDSLPLALAKASQEPKGPYVLESQGLVISISGSFAEVKQFLHLLAGERRMIQTRRLTIKSGSGGQESQVVLELDVLLLELSYVQQGVA